MKGYMYSQESSQSSAPCMLDFSPSHTISPPNLQKEIFTLLPRRQSWNPHRTLKPVYVKVNIDVSSNVYFRHVLSLSPHIQRPHSLLLVHDRALTPRSALHTAFSINAILRGGCHVP